MGYFFYCSFEYDEGIFELTLTTYDDYQQEDLFDIEKDDFKNLDLVKTTGTSTIYASAVFETPRTNEDIKRMTEKLEAMRLLSCKTMNSDPNDDSPITIWKPSLREFDRFRRNKTKLKSPVKHLDKDSKAEKS